MIGYNPFVGEPKSISEAPFLATVTGVDAKGVLLRKDGETKPGEKRYKTLSSYAAAVGDAVICVPVSGTLIVIGKFERG